MPIAWIFILRFFTKLGFGGIYIHVEVMVFFYQIEGFFTGVGVFDFLAPKGFFQPFYFFTIIFFPQIFLLNAWLFSYGTFILILRIFYRVWFLGGITLCIDVVFSFYRIGGFFCHVWDSKISDRVEFIVFLISN